MSRKRRLVDKLNEEFEKLVSEKQLRQYSQYMRAINQDAIEEMPRTRRQMRKIINRHSVNPSTSVKMFSVMNGVQNLLLNPETRVSRQKLKPLESLMRVYNVNNPKSFAKEMYQMTTGQQQSDRNKRFRPLLLSYYDGFTENIETLEQQAQRALKRSELEVVSGVFADMEELRRQRLPITQVKQQLLDKYNDPKRIRRALDTELHEQAERVKLEQSKFMGYTHKKWNTQRDERVRRTKFHNQVSNKVIPVDSKFKAGGITADYPGDIELPVGERINCRCYITYHNEPQAIPTSKPIITPPRRKTSTQATTAPVKRFVEGKNANESMKNFRASYDDTFLVKYNDNFSQNADREFVKETLNGYGELFDTIPSMREYDFTLDRSIKNQGVAGSFTIPMLFGDKKNPTKIKINFQISKYKKNSPFIKTIGNKIESDGSYGFKVPVDEDKTIRYTSEHEVGHSVQCVLLTEKHYAKVTQDPQALGIIKRIKRNRVEIENATLYSKKQLLAFDGMLDSEELIKKSAKYYKDLVFEKYIEKHGENKTEQEVQDEIVKQISGYGKTNDLEFFAEVWTEWRLNTKKPSKLSKVFGEVIGGVLNDIG